MLWPSTTASCVCLPSNHFPLRNQRDSRAHLWPLLSPPINPLASLVPRGKPASLPTWMPYLRCSWLQSLLPPRPSGHRGAGLPLPFLLFPWCLEWQLQGPGPPQAPSSKRHPLISLGALTPASTRIPGRKITAPTLSLPELPVGDVVPLSLSLPPALSPGSAEWLSSMFQPTHHFPNCGFS